MADDTRKHRKPCSQATNDGHTPRAHPHVLYDYWRQEPNSSFERIKPERRGLSEQTEGDSETKMIHRLNQTRINSYEK